MNKKWKRTFKGMKKVKNWRKATHIGGKVLDIGGDALILGGTMTGQPELVAVGVGAKVAGEGLNETSKILKKTE